MSIQTIAVFFMASVAIGGIAWVFLYPHLSGEKHVEKRLATAARTEPALRTARGGAQRSRRDQIEETLKEVEERNKAKSVPLQVRIAQAGLGWTKQRFLLISAMSGLLAFTGCLLINGGLLAALGVAFAASFGLPMWLLSFLKKRREAKFLDNFPDAVDVIVRGIKAGLPLLECLKVVAADSQDPVKTEFRAIIETQTIGLPIGDACARLYERMPVAEANFFGIVILIQQRTGGNLSEALGNLSRVLRDRKRMKAKIQAMSMEAKASGGIIAALPVAVMALVYLSTPDYIALLWTTPTGHIMLMGSAFWMTCGVLAMRKMINFDF